MPRASVSLLINWSIAGKKFGYTLVGIYLFIKFVDFGEKNKKIFIDVSGTPPLNYSYLSGTLNNLDSALTNRATYKTTKYFTWARERNARFVPFVLDTFGRLHKAAADVITLACGELSSLAPSLSRQSSQSLLIELSTLWQRGNGEIISQWSIMCRDFLSGCH